MMASAQELEELRKELERSEAARKQLEDATAGMLQQLQVRPPPGDALATHLRLQSRSERLMNSEAELDKVRGLLARAQADAPAFLREKVAALEQAKKRADGEIKRLSDILYAKDREIKALEGLVNRYQQELATMAANTNAAEASAEGCAAKAQEQVTEDRWENQRQYRLMGWSSQLLPTDPRSYSAVDGNRGSEHLDVPAPAEWEWVDEWQQVPMPDQPCDEHGWGYGFDFDTIIQGTPRSAPLIDDCVRRRRWIRHRMRATAADQGPVVNKLLRVSVELAKLQAQVQQAQRQQAAAQQQSQSLHSSQASLHRSTNSREFEEAKTATVAAAPAATAAVAAPAASSAGTSGAEQGVNLHVSAEGDDAAGEGDEEATADKPTSKKGPTTPAKRRPRRRVASIQED